MAAKRRGLRALELMELPCFPFAPLLLAWGGAFTGTWPFGSRPLDRIEELRVPVLLMGGLQDRRVPFDAVAALAADAGGDAQLIGFPGAGHQSLERADPRRYGEALERFLGRIDGLSRRPRR